MGRGAGEMEPGWKTGFIQRVFHPGCLASYFFFFAAFFFFLAAMRLTSDPIRVVFSSVFSGKILGTSLEQIGLYVKVGVQRKCFFYFPRPARFGARST